MRVMSDFREAMWGVVQTAVSELDFDFAGYAAEHFERLRRPAADPRFEGWLEEAHGDRRELPDSRPLRDHRRRRRRHLASPTTWPSSAGTTSSCSTATS